MDPKLDIKELLKTIEQWLIAKNVDIWDEKYDHVMHNNHWLTSEWSPKCDKCLMKGPNKPEPKPLPSGSPVEQQQQQQQQLQATSTSLNSTVSNTLKNESPISSSPPPSLRSAQPPPIQTEQIIPVTPIAPTHLSSKAFMTPHTSMKFNDTFTRSTRQSTRKLLNQDANNQLLINLNETFDLYQSALAETPVLDGVSTNGEHQQINDKAQQQLLNLTQTNSNGSASTKVLSNMITSPLTSTINTNTTSRMVPPKPRSNFELLTNNQTNLNLDFTPASMQEVVENHHAFSQPTASRMTRIPVRSSRQQDY